MRKKKTDNGGIFHFSLFSSRSSEFDDAIWLSISLSLPSSFFPRLYDFAKVIYRMECYSRISILRAHRSQCTKFSKRPKPRVDNHDNNDSDDGKKDLPETKALRWGATVHNEMKGSRNSSTLKNSSAARARERVCKIALWFRVNKSRTLFNLWVFQRSAATRPRHRSRKISTLESVT